MAGLGFQVPWNPEHHTPWVNTTSLSSLPLAGIETNMLVNIFVTETSK
jgi:hypothetical protein